jgi:tetratricopeptide (TPR) repeat protein
MVCALSLSPSEMLEMKLTIAGCSIDLPRVFDLSRVTILTLCFSATAQALALAPTSEQPVTADLSVPYRALMQGRIDEAVTSLQHFVSARPQDGQAYLLLCRSFYAEEHPDEAIVACESAVAAQARSSDTQDWMGRAYGMKADLAGPIAGLTLARKVREAFETAVALDPNNGAAVNDLSEFYVNAPTYIGGGQARATALAGRVQANLPQEAHRIRALAAEKRKDYAAAEQEFKAAVSVANRPNAWADLAGFYKRRGDVNKAVATLKQCLALDRDRDATLVDAASILRSMEREPRLADEALREYLASNAETDAAPVIKVYVMLGKLLADAGDKQGAKIEFERALKLASNYAPAKEALQQL